MRRIAITLCCLSLIYAGYIEALNLMAWDLARSLAKDNPSLWVKPTPLNDTSVAKLPGPRFERFGLSIELPTDPADSGSEGREFSAIRLKNGGSLIMYKMDVDMVKMTRNASSEERAAMEKLMGEGTLRTSYDFASASAYATPAVVHWWAGRLQNTQGAMLLMNKSVGLPDAIAIHPVNGGVVRGFQYGDPSGETKAVILTLFDAKDRHYQLVLSSKGHRVQQAYTQAQINAMLASTHESTTTQY